MYIESLVRLAEIVSHFNENGEKLISDSFHSETEELITSQSAFLQNELKFKQAEPGPYTFGVGEMTITIFSPEQTETADWAAIARYEKWQLSYTFNSMLGLIYTLKKIFEDFNGRNERTQETTSRTED